MCVISSVHFARTCVCNLVACAALCIPGQCFISFISLCFLCPFLSLIALALLYELKVPRWDFQTGRQLRTSPLYDRLDTQGARWMEKHGFERAKYFVPPGKGERLFEDVFDSFTPHIYSIYFGVTCLPPDNS